MKELTYKNWVQLIDAEGGERLTILMPTEKAGPPTRKNPIRFKNHLAECERLLEARGLNSEAIDGFLGDARALIDDHQFWQHQRDGLAAFIDEQGMRLRRMLTLVSDRVTLSPRFYILPLVDEFLKDTTLYVLALSAGSVRMHRVTRDSIQPVELKDTPGSLDEMLSGVESERQLQFHSGTSRQAPPGSGGDRPAAFHGQGASGDDNEQMVRLSEYCRAINAGVISTLVGEHAPLMIAATEPILSVYRGNSTYPGLVDRAIIGNPESTSPDELHRQALDTFEPIHDAERRRAAERYQQRLGTGEISDEVKDVLVAASDGRVQTLLIKESATEQGIFNEQDRLVETDESLPGTEDLLNLAAIYTLRASGAVHLMPEGEMPTDSKIAAIMRYAQ